MIKFRNILIALCSVPVFLVLLWFFGVPDELITGQIDEAIARSGNRNMLLTIDGLRKGVFFSLYADSLNLHIDNRPALAITDFKGSFTPRYLSDGKPAFDIHGKIGTGDVDGILKVPVEGDVRVREAELSAISYLTRLGITLGGSVSSDIQIQDKTVTIVFDIPDLNISESALAAVPFLNTFHKMQGSLSLTNNTITLESVSLEGEKGYARVKGNITNGIMNMSLEIMPLAGKLNTLESMVISKYIVSPGYYVVPIRGPLL